MERMTDVETSLFEAFLGEDDPGMSRLLAELLDIPTEALAVMPAEPAQWDGVERRSAA